MSHTLDTWIEVLTVEIPVTIEYTYSGGAPASYWEPEEPAEVDILAVTETETGRDLYGFVQATRPDPEIVIREETYYKHVPSLDALVSDKFESIKLRRWIVEVKGDTYLDQLHEHVHENHEPDDGYDDWRYDD